MKSILIIVMIIIPLYAKDLAIRQLFSVDVTSVKKVKLSHSKKYYGYVKADESKVNHIAPRFGGYVVKLYADKIYDYVKKGEPLVSIYSPEVYKAKEDYLNSYEYAKGELNSGMLRSSRLNLELLGVDDSEIKKVVEEKKVSKNTTIYASVDGYVFEKNISEGSAFNKKEKLFELVNLDEVWVEVKLFDEDSQFIHSTENFELKFKRSNTVYTSKTFMLYPNMNQKEATLTLRLSLKNKDHKLFPGMYASIRSSTKSEEYLTLPRSAVIRKNGKHYVFVVGDFDGEYEPLEVRVKVFDNEIYIIEDGLKEGDKVVSNSLFMMDSDAQINGLY